MYIPGLAWELIYECFLRYGDDKHTLHQQLAAILVTVFTEAEGTNFIRHVGKLMPIQLRVLKTIIKSANNDHDLMQGNIFLAQKIFFVSYLQEDI